jgi:predicted MFS family arabinose efflux permease
LILIFKEPAKPTSRSFEWGAFKTFLKKSIIALGMLGLISTMITGGANQLVNPFLRENFSISYMIAGFFTAFWGVGVILGGLTGGRLSDKIGHRRSLLTALFLSLISILLLSVITGHQIAWPIVFFFGVSYGLYEAVYFAASMDMTDKRIAASMFAILMAVANAGSGIGMAVGGRLTDLIGYRWTFVFFAALNLLMIPLLPVVFGKRKR